jgi:DNA polymerase III alpha subunit
MYTDIEKKKTSVPLENGDFPDFFKVLLENELFGFSLRGSPFDILGRGEKIERYLLNKLEAADEDHDYYYGVSYDDAIASQNETLVLPVLVKRIFEKPQRNGQMMCFLTFETMEGKEFDCPCFATIWRHFRNPVENRIDPKKIRRGGVYIGTFSRKLSEDPNNLVVGKPGFAHSPQSSLNYFIDVDRIQLVDAPSQ